MTEPMLQGKTHDIPKRLVWDAWLKVKENKGAAGVDGVTIERFEADLRGNVSIQPVKVTAAATSRARRARPWSAR
jgi:hypothetical protein